MTQIEKNNKIEEKLDKAEEDKNIKHINFYFKCCVNYYFIIINLITL